MSSYNIFAKYYDFLNQNVNYDAGSSFISGIFKDNNVKSFLDLACGTGIITEKLITEGYTAIGVDLSSDMLSQAEYRLSKTKGDYSLIKAQMQDFRLTQSVDACICCLDSINHLVDEKDVLKTFQNVFKSLGDNGVFIFDVNSVYKHQTLLNNRAYVFDEDDFFLSWDNELLENNIVRIMLDFFVYNGESYDRFSEEFRERAYSEEELIKMLNNAGFNNINIFGGFDYSKPNKTSERLFFVCKKEN